MIKMALDQESVSTRSISYVNIRDDSLLSPQKFHLQHSGYRIGGSHSIIPCGFQIDGYLRRVFKKLRKLPGLRTVHDFCECLHIKPSDIFESGIRDAQHNPLFDFLRPGLGKGGQFLF